MFTLYQNAILPGRASVSTPTIITGKYIITKAIKMIARVVAAVLSFLIIWVSS